MAIIDRNKMVCDLKEYLPDANALSEILLNNIINNVIDFHIPDGESAPVDDDEFYSEDLCKSLKASALLNKAKFAVDGSTTRKEKVDEVEVEQFEAAARFAWDDYIKSLSDICPWLPGGGYKPSKPIGALINPSDKFVIDDAPCFINTRTSCSNGCVNTCTCSAAESIFNPCSTSNKLIF